MRILKEPAAEILVAARLPKSPWSFVLLNLAHFRNQLGHRSLRNFNPYEKLGKSRLNLSCLQKFGYFVLPMLKPSQRGPTLGTN